MKKCVYFQKAACGLAISLGFLIVQWNHAISTTLGTHKRGWISKGGWITGQVFNVNDESINPCVPDLLAAIARWHGVGRFCGSAQDYLEVVKMGSDKHTYNIFQSNNNIKCIIVVWSLNDKDHQYWSKMVSGGQL